MEKAHPHLPTTYRPFAVIDTAQVKASKGTALYMTKPAEWYRRYMEEIMESQNSIPMASMVNIFISMYGSREKKRPKRTVRNANAEEKDRIQGYFRR